MNRNKTVDISKYIAIVMVIWGHIIAGKTNTTAVAINVAHMPLFFFVSGNLLWNSQTQNNILLFIKKKIKRLILPYLIWSTISFATHIIVCLISGPKMDLEWITNEALDIFVYSRSCWFLIVLFIAESVWIILYNVCNNNDLLFVILSILLYISILFFSPCKLLSLYRLRWLFPFLGCGWWSAKISNNSTWRRIRNVIFGVKSVELVIFVAAIYILYAFLVTSKLDLSGSCFKHIENGIELNQYMLWEIGGIFGVMTISLCAHAISQSKVNFLCKMGQYTLDIYVMHMFFVYVFRYLNDSILVFFGNDLIALTEAVLVSVFLYEFDKNLLRHFRLFVWSMGE